VRSHLPSSGDAAAACMWAPSLAGCEGSDVLRMDSVLKVPIEGGRLGCLNTKGLGKVLQEGAGCLPEHCGVMGV